MPVFKGGNHTKQSNSFHTMPSKQTAEQSGKNLGENSGYMPQTEKMQGLNQAFQNL